MRYPYFLLPLLCLLLTCRPNDRPPAPFLSQLQAGSDAPLYATYAAAMERSQFTPDEGYEFRYYRPEAGPDFCTDTGGDLGVGFRVGDRWIYRSGDCHAPPVITVSYPDLVRYYYYPVAGLRVEGAFLVYSSSAALLELTLHNESGGELDLSVVPFLRNEYRTFNDIEALPDGRGWRFNHEEFADNWTRGHGLPHVDSLQNLLLLSEPADAAFACNSLEGESPVLPFEALPDRAAVYQINGRAFTPAGERIMARPPVSRFQVFRKDDPSRLVTENSPAWGASQGSIDLDGYFRAELGLLGPVRNGDSFTFTFFNETEKAAHRVSRSITDAAQPARRIDMPLGPVDLPPVVEGVKLHFDRAGRPVRLSWTAPGEGYSVGIYQRVYPETIYRRIVGGLSDTTFTLPDTSTDQLTGYILLAEDRATGATGMHSREVLGIPPVAFADYLRTGVVPPPVQQYGRIVGMEKRIRLASGARTTLRLIRQVGSTKEVLTPEEKLFALPIDSFQRVDERLFAAAPRPAFRDRDQELLYWSAFNMMRQVFYPPEAKSSYNYYVFSREPTWGWGHGGQVFHESLTMPAYALLDPVSAMNSQRVFAERQYPNGYINYRTGSYLDEIIEYEGQLTSSAPWYAWINEELARQTGDTAFLREMYESSRRFYEFYIAHRDGDGDGLCEWGGHAVLESVRDAAVAVWDEVGWPANFEGLDLNCMLVMEAKALEKMARALGREAEADRWRQDHEARTALINRTFWDEATGFYYHVDKTDHDFSFQKPDDLKRMEIIGFLPLWAGVAPPDRAARLLDHLRDTTKFWRPFGIPSLAADDPFYNARGYWNGPVWVEWNWLIERGLLDYGYREEARELARRVADGMIRQLKRNHNLWEFYSPDSEWAGYHRTYIWAGVINRMLLDADGDADR